MKGHAEHWTARSRDTRYTITPEQLEELLCDVSDARKREIAGTVRRTRGSAEQVLDGLKAWARGNSETIEADDGTLEDAVFLGELLAKIEELRQQQAQQPGGDPP